MPITVLPMYMNICEQCVLYTQIQLSKQIALAVKTLCFNFSAPAGS